MAGTGARHPDPAVPSAWSDLGAWNLYFLVKFAMLWMGMLDFHPLLNLAFAAALLLPLRPRWARLARQLLAIPAGVVLFYHDTWLPPFGRLLAQPGVLDFSLDYLVELVGRFINWTLVAAVAVLALGYVLLRPWLRITTFSVIGLLAVTLAQLPWPSGWLANPAAPASAGAPAAAGRRALAPADTPTLNAYLQQFYQSEAARKTRFPMRDAAAAPFDVLVINICSLAWSDLDEVGMRDNALLGKMDLVFDRFNSATSYSGPAAIRLLRASCGQSEHSKLYDPAGDGCYLFQNLAQLGFQNELAMNHDGHFDDFIGELRDDGRLDATALDITAMPRAMAAFDQSPIRRDGTVLQTWWTRRLGEAVPQVALFYNTISLHDGNRLIGPAGTPVPTDFKARAQTVLGDLAQFVDTLQASGRRVMLVVVPEHGAALHGDRMQIPGMREIPSPAISEVPAAVKLINMGAPVAGAPRHIADQTSYLALSELIARVYAADAAGGALDWAALLRELPQTEPVAESAGAKVIDYDGKPYVQLKGRNDWMPYPEDRK